MASKYIFNMRRSFFRACPGPGTSAPGLWVATGYGRTSCARLTTIHFVGLIIAWYWRASIALIFQPGRRGPFFQAWTPANGSMKKPPTQRESEVTMKTLTFTLFSIHLVFFLSYASADTNPLQVVTPPIQADSESYSPEDFTVTEKWEKIFADP